MSPAKFSNQRFLNYIHKFSADGDYVFFARSEVEQHHLSSLISTVIQRCRSGTTAGLMTTNFKENMITFIPNSDAFFFISDIKIAYYKQFLFDVLAMVKLLGIPIFYYVYPRRDELPIVINKLNEPGLTKDELKKSKL